MGLVYRKDAGEKFTGNRVLLRYRVELRAYTHCSSHSSLVNSSLLLWHEAITIAASVQSHAVLT